jgi:transposase
MLRPTGWWLALEPIDLRCGMDRLLVLVQTQFGHDGFDGAAYALTSCAVEERFAIVPARG